LWNITPWIHATPEIVGVMPRGFRIVNAEADVIFHWRSIGDESLEPVSIINRRKTQRGCQRLDDVVPTPWP
jgi:hypothetical protein